MSMGGGGGGGISLPKSIEDTSLAPLAELGNTTADHLSEATPDIKIDPDNVTTFSEVDSLEEISNVVSEVTPDIKVDPIAVAQQILPDVNDVQSITGAMNQIHNAYQGSDLQKGLDHNIGQVTNVINTVTQETHGLLDRTVGAIPDIINNPFGDNTGDVDAEIAAVENVPVPTTAQPLVSGDVSNAALQEQFLPGMNIRQDMMNPLSGGRRKTMLTLGQSAAKINARRTG